MQKITHFLEKKKIKAGLGLAPGEWFGPGGEGFYRMTIASPKEVIEDTFKRLRNSLNDE